MTTNTKAHTHTHSSLLCLMNTSIYYQHLGKLLPLATTDNISFCLTANFHMWLVLQH